MRRALLSPALVLALHATAVGAAPAPQVETAAVAYVQATVVEPNPAAGSLGFVSAGGQSRVVRAGGRALASLPNLRPGDDVILVLEGPATRPVVTAVKMARPAPAMPAAETVTSPYAQAMTTSSSRPSWPNPYSRINPGLPLRPARAPRARGGTLTVMPAGLPAGGPPPQPIAAPAVLTPVSAAPVVPVRDEASTVDVLRARGTRDYEAAVSRLAAEARQVDAAYARYKASCPNASAMSQEGSREWFGLWDGSAVSETSAGCAALLDEMSRLGAPIKAGMLAAQEAARRAWVLPGTMRDVRRRHTMEWSGWDR